MGYPPGRLLAELTGRYNDAMQIAEVSLKNKKLNKTDLTFLFDDSIALSLSLAAKIVGHDVWKFIWN